MADTTLFTLTPNMLEPLVETVTANAAVLLPVGLTIMGIFVAISLIPKIFYRFF